MAEDERQEGEKQEGESKEGLRAKAKDTVAGAKDTVAEKASSAQAAVRDGGVWRKVLVPIGAGAAGLLTAVVVRKGPDFITGTVVPKLKEALPENLAGGDSRRAQRPEGGEREQPAEGQEQAAETGAARGEEERGEQREMQLTDALDREAARRARAERRRQRRESLSI